MRGQVRSGMQTQEPEGTLVPHVQLHVGQLERGTQLPVLGTELGQRRAAGPQPVGQVRHTPARAVPQPVSQQLDGHREVTAEADHRADGFEVGIRGEPGGSGEQQGRVLGFEHVQRKGAGGVQAREAAPTRDQYDAPRRTGQQRPDLLVAEHVVEDEQDAPAG